MKTALSLAVLALGISLAPAWAGDYASVVSTVSYTSGEQSQGVALAREITGPLPGQVVKSLPGQFTRPLPGQVTGALPGQVIQPLPGQIVNCLPGQLQNGSSRYQVLRYFLFATAK